MQVSMVMHSVLSKWLGCSSSKAMIHRKKHGSIKPQGEKRSTTVLSLNLSVGAYRLNRNFLGAIVTHMWVLSPFSLIQNRTGDFCAPVAHLRGSALQPSTQCTASLHAVYCIRPRKYSATLHASTCNPPRKYVHPSLQVRASVLASTCVWAFL